MVRKSGDQHSRRASSGASATDPGAESTAPTPGLENVIFTWGTTRDSARYLDTVNQLARYISTRTWSQSTVATKVMIELVIPVSVSPVRPARKYYVAIKQSEAAPTPRAETTDRFADDNAT